MNILSGFTLFLKLVLISCSCAVAHADDPTEQICKIVEAIGKQELKTGKVVGLSIGVANSKSLICVRGFGLANVEHNIPVTDKSVFRIGSITKLFTAAAVLKLVEMKKLNLDDPLTNFIPEYPSPAGQATIRQLLHHTSGIKDLTRLPTYWRDRQYAAKTNEILARFKDLPRNFDPDVKHQYCNSGYLLLGVVIEKASKQSYRQFVEEYLFKAAGLNSTYCDNQSTLIPNRAEGYSRWGGKLRTSPHVHVKNSTGAGNITTTTRDLLTWQQALVGYRVLEKKTFQLMTTKGKLKNGKSFGYGMGYFIGRTGTHQVIRHGGAISGFRAELAWYPKSEFIIVVQANCDPVNARKIVDNVAAELLKIKTEQASK